MPTPDTAILQVSITMAETPMEAVLVAAFAATGKLCPLHMANRPTAPRMNVVTGNSGIKMFQPNGETLPFTHPKPLRRVKSTKPSINCDEVLIYGLGIKS
jgi:hypothetical protein